MTTISGFSALLPGKSEQARKAMIRKDEGQAGQVRDFNGSKFQLFGVLASVKFLKNGKLHRSKWCLFFHSSGKFS